VNIQKEESDAKINNELLSFYKESLKYHNEENSDKSRNRQYNEKTKITDDIHIVYTKLLHLIYSDLQLYSKIIVKIFEAPEYMYIILQGR
jgi:hypothetical protein